VKQPDTADQTEPVTEEASPPPSDERAIHLAWLREENTRLAALIAPLPDSFHLSRGALESHMSKNRREWRELLGLSPEEKTKVQP